MKYFLVILFILFLCPLFGQEEVAGDTTENEKIKIVYADLQRTILQDGEYIRYLEGQVQIIKDSSYFYADTALVSQNFIKAWGDVSMQESDTSIIYADSIIYDIAKEEAEVIGSVYIENGSQIIFSDDIKYNDKTDIVYYVNKAIIKNDSTEIRSKRGEYQLNASKAIFSQNVSVINDQFQLFGDTLIYYALEDKVEFVGPTDIIQDNSKLYCEDGYYFIESQQGLLAKNASYISDKDTAIADSIYIDGLAKTVEMIGHARYTSDSTYAQGDIIRYNDETKKVIILGNAYVKDGKQELKGKNLEFNQKTKEFVTTGRSKITMDNAELIANNIDSKDGKGSASGDIIVIDSTNNLRIDGDQLYFSQEEANYKIFGEDSQTLTRTVIENNDSLFIVSDTLHMTEVINIDTIVKWEIDTNMVEEITETWKIDTIREVNTYRYDSTKVETVREVAKYDSTALTSVQMDSTEYLLAYGDVKLLSEDIQLVCDSLAYNRTDSIITLFGSPMMWTDTTQFTADTIKMHLKDNKIHRIEMYPMSRIINTADQEYFNQIGGKKTTAYFTDSSLDSMNVTGNAESVYYMIDEFDAYIGVNNTICSAMTFHFNDKKLERVYFFTKPTSKMFPMNKVNHKELRLDGFIWEFERRPQRKENLHPLLKEMESF